MKKTYLLIGIMMAVALMTAGCNKVSEVPPVSEVYVSSEVTPPVEAESEEVQPEPVISEPVDDKNNPADAVDEDEWKAAYLEYIDKVLSEHWDEYSDVYNGDFNEAACDDYFYFKLIYIDGDDIPELVIGAGSELLASYHNGKLQKFAEIASMNPTPGLYSGVISYIEREGKLIWQTGGHSGRNEIVCLLKSSGFSQDCAGTIAYWDFDYEHPDYYFWDEWDEYGNGVGDDIESYKCKNKADYDKKMSQYYDYSKATDGLGTSGMYYKYSEIVAYLSGKPTDAPAAENNADWKQAYKDTINGSNYNSERDYWALIYLDSDDIPELVCVLDNCTVWYYTFHDGKAVELLCAQQRMAIDGRFIPGEGLICDCDETGDPESGGTHTYTVYKLSDGKLTTIFNGAYSYGGYDDDSFEKKYYIDNQEVTSEQYGSAFDACFDQNKAISFVNPKSYNSMTYSEIINALSK